mgnify:CR=1 FL=1
MVSDIYKYRNRVDYLHDFPGANVEKDKIITIAAPAETYPVQEDTPLDVSGAVVTVTDDGNLQIYDSSGNVIEEPLDVSSSTVTITDDGSLEVSAIPDVVVGDWTAGEISVDENTGATTTELASADDISGGVSTSISKRNYTVYLENTGASSSDVTISYSPDGGNTYFDDPNGVITVSSGSTEMVEIGYEATNIQVTASNTEPFNVHIVER